jgi:hypothetical protein
VRSRGPALLLFCIGRRMHSTGFWVPAFQYPSVYDPFLGSGTTLIAAETTGRVCLGMELEPRYVDVAVAVRRWQAFTGLEACLLGDGRLFEVVAAERLAGLQPTNLGPVPTQPVETALKNDLAAT